MTTRRAWTEPARLVLLMLLAWPALQGVASAQDLEPRRWAHFPIGTNVAGLAYLYTDGDVFFEPVLEAEDVELDLHTIVATYAHWFDLLGKTGRVDVVVAYDNARWEGLLSGTPTSVEREGFGDPWLRLSVNLAGGPALKGKEFQEYRASRPASTVVGAAVAVSLPLGEYKPDKLLNLGQNRFIVRPQAGVVHTRGSWSFELTGSAFIFTENDDFFGGNDRKQDPLFAFQAHLIHTFPNRWWASVSGGYNWGGESKINGERKGDERSDILAALSFGFPIGKKQALKVAYLRGDTQNMVGRDANLLLTSWTFRF